MKFLKLLIIVAILTVASLAAYAQEGDGQICIRAFEDRNSNAVFDANEPPITQGVSVNLMSSAGVTIDSKLLVDSQTAAQGVVCFQQLLIGDYTVLITSADYSAVTPTTFNASVVAGSVPVRFDFGATLIGGDTSITTSSDTTTQASQNQVMEGILFGIIGAIVVMGILVIAGMFIYFAVFRSRMNRIAATQSTGSFRPVTGPMPAYNPGTGSMPAYNPGTDSMPAYRSTPPTTGSTPAVQANNPLLTRDPNEGSPPLFNEEDTDQMGSIKD